MKPPLTSPFCLIKKSSRIQFPFHVWPFPLTCFTVRRGVGFASLRQWLRSFIKSHLFTARRGAAFNLSYNHRETSAGRFILQTLDETILTL